MLVILLVLFMFAISPSISFMRGLPRARSGAVRFLVAKRSMPRVSRADYPVARQHEVEVRIEDLSNSGNGVGRLSLENEEDKDKKWVVFVPNTLPGELVRVRIVKNMKSFSQAELVSVLEKSEDRVSPPCKYFGECGGCDYQHMTLAAQRTAKRAQVINALTKIGKINKETLHVNEVLGTNHEYHYRTKITPHYIEKSPSSTSDASVTGAALDAGISAPTPVPLSAEVEVESKSSRFLIGFQRKNSNSVVDVRNCMLATPAVNERYAEMREEIAISGVGGLGLGERVEGEGEGEGDGAASLNKGVLKSDKSGLGLGRKSGSGSYQASGTLLFREGEEGVMTNARDTVTQTLRGGLLSDSESEKRKGEGDIDIGKEEKEGQYKDQQKESEKRKGEGDIDIGKEEKEEEVGDIDIGKEEEEEEERSTGVSFTFSADSFFQNNAHALPVLTQHVAAQLIKGNGDKEHFLVDAYCGSGLFSLLAAPHFSHVYGVEISANAVEAARANAVQNDVPNTTFFTGKSEAIFEQVSNLPSERTVVLIDPPRAGCVKEFLSQLMRLRPWKIVYVSCDPATQARDARIILNGGYDNDDDDNNNDDNKGEGWGGGMEGEREKKRGYSIVDVTPVDLFPQTRHIENVITFVCNAK